MKLAKHTFSKNEKFFSLDGRPFQIISGEIHYPRIPRAYWPDRLRKIHSLGMNTVSFYTFWNLHEPEQGIFDFEGNLDVASFIEMAQEEGLWVLLRPGPYVCAEFDLGGLPPWLLAYSDMKLRTSDANFLRATEKYLLELGRRISHLQITRGGPIIMVQVENEYGEFGADLNYLRKIELFIRRAGFDTILFTCNEYRPGIGTAGTLPGVVAAANFAHQTDPKKAWALFKHEHGIDSPPMVSEFWSGSTDHWNEHHKKASSLLCSRRLDWLLSHKISVNLYMAHGGTTFGFMAGANFETKYRPIPPSYDFDAPIDEAGRPTRMFFTIREVISKYRDSIAPYIPQPSSLIQIPLFALKESCGLDNLLTHPILSERPRCMESLGQSYGFILYRSSLTQTIPSSGRLEVKDLHDYALVMQGGKILGTIDRQSNQTGLDVSLSESAPLDILVENMGRICYGQHMSEDRKGITERVSFQGKELTGWEIFPLPMSDLSKLVFGVRSAPSPSFFRGHFELDSLGDTFLDMREWGKGSVWVNGRNLGRYWRIGPQKSLFLPAPWLNKGVNEVVVLDLEEGHEERFLKGNKDRV